jgi:hypothetical protein
VNRVKKTEPEEDNKTKPADLPRIQTNAVREETPIGNLCVHRASAVFLALVIGCGIAALRSLWFNFSVLVQWLRATLPISGPTPLRSLVLNLPRQWIVRGGQEGAVHLLPLPVHGGRSWPGRSGGKG